jgi:ParB family transcriptional regulator, chromosome partitioning protein
VRATEDSVRVAEEAARTRRGVASPIRRRSPELTAVEDSLQRALLARVRITGSERRGKIEIIYTSAEELERVAGLLGARY